MCLWSRVACLVVSICCTASAARAVEVNLWLDHATKQQTQICPFGCSFPVVPVAVLPANPRGPGSVIDIDAAGELIQAVLNLEGYSLDGMPVAAWAGAIEQGVGGLLVRDPDHPWAARLLTPNPYQPGPPRWSMRLTRMTSQSDFSGELVMHIDQLGIDDYDDLPPGLRWDLTFRFESIPTSAPPPCLGEVLLLDFDGDGEPDSRENGWDSTDSFGGGVDENGTTIADFCRMGVRGEMGGTQTCSRRDFRNDEPLRAKPGDCLVIRQRGDRLCEPRELFFQNVPPVSTPRTCMGHALFDDADADGEPNFTDRCASTPAGALVDGNGCSVEQFCSQQTAQLCGRSDFRNDEPLLKKPRDCARARSTPPACAAAEPS